MPIVSFIINSVCKQIQILFWSGPLTIVFCFLEQDNLLTLVQFTLMAEFGLATTLSCLHRLKATAVGLLDR